MRTYFYALLLIFCFTHLELLAQKSTNPVAREMKFCVDNRDYKRLSDLCDSVLSTKPPNDTLSMLAYMYRAESNQEQMHYLNALLDFTEFRLRYPDDGSDCLLWIALDKRYLGDYEGSEAAYLEMLDMDSNEAMVYVNLASLYNIWGKPTKAYTILKRYPVDQGFHVGYYYNLAETYLLLNQPDSALMEMKKHDSMIEVDTTLSQALLYAKIYRFKKDKVNACYWSQIGLTKLAETRWENDIDRLTKEGFGCKYFEIMKDEIKLLKNIQYICR